MQVAKWGNSLAIRLPAAVVEILGLKEGDDINVRAYDPNEVRVERKPLTQELLDRLDKYRGRMPADFKFDRGEANER